MMTYCQQQINAQSNDVRFHEISLDSRDSHYSGANNNEESDDKSPKLRNFRSRANSSSSINTAISGSSVSSMISISSSRRSHWPFGK